MALAPNRRHDANTYYVPIRLLEDERLGIGQVEATARGACTATGTPCVFWTFVFHHCILLHCIVGTGFHIGKILGDLCSQRTVRAAGGEGRYDR